MSVKLVPLLSFSPLPAIPAVARLQVAAANRVSLFPHDSTCSLNQGVPKAQRGILAQQHGLQDRKDDEEDQV